MRTVLAFVLTLGLAGLGTADDAQKELDRLQGEWEIVRAEVAGKAIPLEQIRDKFYTMKGDELIPSQNPKDPGKLTLKPEKKPAWVDLTDKSKDTMPGIYRIDGDKWEICLGEPKGARPTEFKTTTESKTYLMVLQRKAK